MKLSSVLAVTLFMVMAFSCRKNISTQADSGSIYGDVVSSDATVADRVYALKHVGKYSDANLAAAREGGGIVFGGNSQMERLLYNNWDATWKGLPVINRAIGGTTWAEQIPYIDDLFTDYRPKVIVLYQGENEYLRAPITSNKEISKTIEPNFIKFYDKLRARNPKAKIIIVSMVACPELFRRGYEIYRSGFSTIYDIDNLNKIYKNKLAKDNRATRVTTRYVDIKPLYQQYFPTRQPLPGKFQPDGIHVKYAEYGPWVNKMKPVITDLYNQR